MLGQEELDRRFTYHKPIGDQPARYETIRSSAKKLAALIGTLCPPSRELAIAITRIEEAVFWANAAIARTEEEEAAPEPEKEEEECGTSEKGE